MDLKITSLGIACALALAACGDSAPPAERQAPAAQPAPAPAPAAEPVATADPAAPADPAAGQAADPAAAAAASGKPDAVVENCATTIEGNDAMQFNVGAITVPASCGTFTITLRHVGSLPVAAMGHNVVIALASDRQAIATDGMAAGVDGSYVKADDARVIAHSDLVGGGGSTSVSFPVSAIQGPGPYEFFCSFPGHWAMMRGTIRVG